ncbi:MAG: F0F1 ATP synthase subunit A [Malacoplasma sp.]|nr:F0F1 ATP synthase subunit A [Malacoplasma sp.]
MIFVTDDFKTSMQYKAQSAFDYWNPFELRPEIISILVVTIILAGTIIYYYFSIKKLDPRDPPKGLAFFIFNLISYFKGLVYDVLGKNFVKYTPYLLTVFVYILTCNVISVIGFENPTALTTVTFALGLGTTLGSIIIGIRYQKTSYFYRFLFKFYVKSKKTGRRIMIPYFLNPFGVVEIITPWISISLRLWANILSGALIITLFYAIPMVFFQRDPTVYPAGPEIILFSFFAIPVHGFLDWLVGSIQAFVFVILTMCYWNSASELEDEVPIVKKIKKEKNSLLELQNSAEIRGKANVNLINEGSI